MLRSLLRSLLTDLLIAVALLAATLVLPVAGFWMCRDSVLGTIFFFVAPFTACVWCLFIVQLGGSRFWRGREYVLAHRAAHGGYWGVVWRGMVWMFGTLFLSYAVEFAVIFLVPYSPTLRHIFPIFAYSPVLLALWRAYRG